MQEKKEVVVGRTIPRGSTEKTHRSLANLSFVGMWQMCIRHDVGNERDRLLLHQAVQHSQTVGLVPTLVGQAKQQLVYFLCVPWLACLLALYANQIGTPS